MKIILALQKIILLCIILFLFGCSAEEQKRRDCYANVGCHNAFLSCQINYGAVITNKGERDAWCVFQVISCRDFCARCGGSSKYGNDRPCFTKRYALGLGALSSD
jgi:hypothetical protein